jgi:hypothetical protein
MTTLAVTLRWTGALLVLCGMICVAFAGLNMSPSVLDRFAEFNLRSGIFGPRSNFTDRGWKYRNRAWVCIASAVLAMLLSVIL